MHIADHIIDSLSHVFDVLLAHYTDIWSVIDSPVVRGTLTATDGCPAGLEQVNVVLVLESMDLLGRKTGVGEHAVLHGLSVSSLYSV